MMMMVVGLKFGNAQTTTGGLNQELRSLLSSISKPNLCAPFLYDMVGHCTDEMWFTHSNYTDTNNWSNWYNIFDEMKYSAYNINLLPNTIELVDKADLLIKKDTIPIGLMNFDFNIFKDSVFNKQGEFFTWDDNNIFDAPNRIQSPYLWNSIFLASPLSQTSEFREVNYKISKEFIFQSAGYRFPGTSIDEEFLYIDFGDGSGWRLFNLNKDSIVNIIYPRKGNYLIKFGLFTCDPFPNCSKTPGRYSQSYIQILSDALIMPPDKYLDLPGMNVGYYKGCDPNSGKVLIYLEGNDFNDSKSVHYIYRDMFESDNIHLKSLRAYNYNVYIVDWKKSNADVRKNALSFVKLLELLKSNIDPSNNEQFVVIGESMGGLIARLALNYMESEDYQSHIAFDYDPQIDDIEAVELNYIATELMHNTRLFISIDAPHQGAYVPVSIQHAVYRIKELENKYPDVYSNGNYFPLLMLTHKAKDIYEKSLQSKAVKQMLIYHINGWNLSQAPNSYTTLQDKEELYNLINNYKPFNFGMPEYCKNMAISSGLLTGQRQTDYNGNFLPAGFKISDVEIDFKKKIFRLIEKKIINIKYELRALPEIGSKGVVFDFVSTKNRFTLRGCLRRLFNKDYNCGNYKDEMKENITVSDVIPYDVIAGGHINVFWLYNQNQFESSKLDWFVYSHDYKVDPASGVISGDFSYGLLTSKLMKLEITTDALLYNFIPVKSALNFASTNTNNWEINFYTLKNKDLFNNTGFDLINGYRRTKDYPNEINNGHVNFENSMIKPFKNNSNKILQREIGDDKIYLNNYSIKFPIILTINDSVFLGKPNPIYNYNSSNINLKSGYDNYLSRNEVLDINANSTLKINYSKGYFIDNSNCNNCIINNSLFETMSTIPFCSNLLRNGVSEEYNGSILDQNGFNLYPNPTNNLINIQLHNYNYSKLLLINQLGQILLNEKFEDKLITIDVSSYSAGIYNIVLIADDQISKAKFIIQK